jgi:hypothetical protein
MLAYLSYPGICSNHAKKARTSMRANEELHEQPGMACTGIPLRMFLIDRGSIHFLRLGGLLTDGSAIEIMRSRHPSPIFHSRFVDCAGCTLKFLENSRRHDSLLNTNHGVMASTKIEKGKH